MPLDLRPVRVWRITTELEGRELVEYAGEFYTSHFATCPNAEQHRRSKP